MTNSTADDRSFLTVVSPVRIDDLVFDEKTGDPILSETDKQNDDMDIFNHPRFRRALLLRALQERAASATSNTTEIVFETPSNLYSDLALYRAVHSPGLVGFLTTAWNRWDALGEAGQDPSGYLNTTMTTTDNNTATPAARTPPLVPSNCPLPRLAQDHHRQRSSQHVLGQVGYYCTDLSTPVFAALHAELQADAVVVEAALTAAASKDGIAYALVTHPGHHGAADSFGGYCYLNHAAAAAQYWLSPKQPTIDKDSDNKKQYDKVAILDVDYHCGNGTASIFEDRADVLVVSIHCDPDYDYPFHSGFADQTGVMQGVGTTLHLPLAPGTTWKGAYEGALKQGLEAIAAFGAQAVILSLGLDTLNQDPCAIRRAGFLLEGEDYQEMGTMMGSHIERSIPVVVIQEGGYRMDKIGDAASNVVTAFCQARQSAPKDN